MRYILFTLTIMVFVLSLTITAQVPNKISYQGLLTTSSGTPVQDGGYDLKFDFYNLSTAGELRYTETQNSITVESGTFSVILHPPVSIFSESLWVEVTAMSGPISGLPVTFSPRTELTSAPYSLAPWKTSGSNIYYSTGEAGTGFVGIGTAEPQYDLHIKDAWYANLMLENTTTDLGNTFANKAGNVTTYFNTFPQDYSPSQPRYKPLSSMIETDGINGLSFVTMNNAPIEFYTDGNYQRITITGSGNVGIGSTNPEQKLDVAGIVQMTGFKMTSNPSIGYVLTSDTSGEGTWQPIGASGTAGGDLSGFYPNPTIADNAITSAKIVDGTITGNDISNSATLNVSSLKGKILTGSHPAEFIGKDEGRIRISDTSDICFNSQEHLGASGGRTKLMYLGDRSNPGNVLTVGQFGLPSSLVIKNGGNVGIGMTTPSKKLEVEGSVKVRDTLFASNVSSNSPLSIQTSGTSRLYIDDVTGYIGLGTTTPSEWLTLGTSSGKPTIYVRGDIDRTFTGFLPDKPAFATHALGGTCFGIAQVWGGLGLIGYDIDTYGAGNIQFFTGNNVAGIPSTERMRITFNGNVGIGTTDPGSNKLKVQGSAQITDALLVNGPSTFGSSIAIDGNISAMGDMNASGDASITGNLNVSGLITGPSTVTGTTSVTTGTPVDVFLCSQSTSEEPALWIANAFPSSNATGSVEGTCQILIQNAGTNLYRTVLRITHTTNPGSTVTYKYYAMRLR